MIHIGVDMDSHRAIGGNVLFLKIFQDILPALEFQAFWHKIACFFVLEQFFFKGGEDLPTFFFVGQREK